MDLKNTPLSADDLALLLGAILIEVVDALALPGTEAKVLDVLSSRLDLLAEKTIVPRYSDTLRLVADIISDSPTVEDR